MDGKGWEVWDKMNKDIIYRGVAAELVKQGKTRKEAAEHLGISMGTLANKLRGVTPFTLDEAVALRDWLRPGCPLETLFEKNALRTTKGGPQVSGGNSKNCTPSAAYGGATTYERGRGR